MTRTFLFVMAVLLAALPSGCGNAIEADVVGMTAVSVDRDGRPVVVVAVCSDHIDRVEVFGTREGLDESEPNPEVGSWTSSKAHTGSFTIQVAHPGADWTASGPIDFQPERGYIVNASRSDADVETSQVSFSGRDLAELHPGQLIVLGGEPWTREKFDAEACG